MLVRDAEAIGDPYAAHAGDALAAARFHDLRHTHATELLAPASTSRSWPNASATVRSR